MVLGVEDDSIFLPRLGGKLEGQLAIQTFLARKYDPAAFLSKNVLELGYINLARGDNESVRRALWVFEYLSLGSWIGLLCRALRFYERKEKSRAANASTDDSARRFFKIANLICISDHHLPPPAATSPRAAAATARHAGRTARGTGARTASAESTTSATKAAAAASTARASREIAAASSVGPASTAGTAAAAAVTKRTVSRTPIAGQTASLPAYLVSRARLAVGERVPARTSTEFLRRGAISIGCPSTVLRIVLPLTTCVAGSAITAPNVGGAVKIVISVDVDVVVSSPTTIPSPTTAPCCAHGNTYSE